MKNNITVKNPLTIIAIFAGIAEVSGTVVLPFVSTENQETFIWFLMIFPIILVVGFFITLNKNHKVLYAPSDYKDEENFMKFYQPDRIMQADVNGHFKLHRAWALSKCTT